MQVLKRFVGGVGVALVLSGCAAQVISSSPRSVIVKARTQDIADASSLAEAECTKHGLHAKFNSKPMLNQYAFDCVN